MMKHVVVMEVILLKKRWFSLISGWCLFIWEEQQNLEDSITNSILPIVRSGVFDSFNFCMSNRSKYRKKTKPEKLQWISLIKCSFLFFSMYKILSVRCSILVLLLLLLHWCIFVCMSGFTHIHCCFFFFFFFFCSLSSMMRVCVHAIARCTVSISYVYYS